MWSVFRDQCQNYVSSNNVEVCTVVDTDTQIRLMREMHTQYLSTHCTYCKHVHMRMCYGHVMHVYMHKQITLCSHANLLEFVFWNVNDFSSFHRICFCGHLRLVNDKERPRSTIGGNYVSFIVSSCRCSVCLAVEGTIVYVGRVCRHFLTLWTATDPPLSGALAQALRALNAGGWSEKEEVDSLGDCLGDKKVLRASERRNITVR